MTSEEATDIETSFRKLCALVIGGISIGLVVVVSAPILIYRHYEFLEFQTCVKLGGDVGSDYNHMTCTLPKSARNGKP